MSRRAFLCVESAQEEARYQGECTLYQEDR